MKIKQSIIFFFFQAVVCVLILGSTATLSQTTDDQADTTPTDTTPTPPDDTQGDVDDQHSTTTDTLENPPVTNGDQPPPTTPPTIPPSSTQTPPISKPTDACPETKTAGTLTLNHNITQDYQGNKTTSVVSGSISLWISRNKIQTTGINTLKVAVSGSFPDAQCTLSGERNVVITVVGNCENSFLNLVETETYQTTQATMKCPSLTKPFSIAASSIAHPVKMPMQNGASQSTPFSGETGSGVYSWTLKLP